MKKLMIALAAVAVGIAANAASYTWSVSSGRIYIQQMVLAGTAPPLLPSRSRRAGFSCSSAWLVSPSVASARNGLYRRA